MERRFDAWIGRKAKLVALCVPHDCGIGRRRRLRGPAFYSPLLKRSEREDEAGRDRRFVRLLVVGGMMQRRRRLLAHLLR